MRRTFILLASVLLSWGGAILTITLIALLSSIYLFCWYGYFYTGIQYSANELLKTSYAVLSVSPLITQKAPASLPRMSLVQTSRTMLLECYIWLETITLSTILVFLLWFLLWSGSSCWCFTNTATDNKVLLLQICILIYASHYLFSNIAEFFLIIVEKSSYQKSTVYVSVVSLFQYSSDWTLQQER